MRSCSRISCRRVANISASQFRVAAGGGDARRFTVSANEELPASGYSWRFIKIVARLSGDRRANLRPAGNRSRVRHDRFSHTARPSCPACNCTRTFPPMSNVVCRASVSDANEFRPASATDARRVYEHRVSRRLACVRRRLFLALRACSERDQYSVCSAATTSSTRVRAWLHRWCRFACRVLGIRIKTRGSMPSSGLLVSNHLSYLDIVVFSSIRPCVFVAKRDVASVAALWLAGARRRDNFCRSRAKIFEPAKSVDVVRDAIAGGSVVVLFPEGTSSDGSTVLPFKSALLESAVQLRSPIAAASIDYDAR